MEWYLKVLKNYANFNGRARRKEYWMFTLFNVLIVWGLMIVFGILVSINENVGKIFLVIPILYIIALLIPTIAVIIRRLHDTNQTGVWILIYFVPLGNLVLFIMMCMDSTPGPNRYGPNPKEINYI